MTSTFNNTLDSIRDSVWNSVRDSVRNSVTNSARNSVRDFARNSIGALYDSVYSTKQKLKENDFNK